MSLCDVPHLHVTLTINDLLWPFFLAYRSLLKLLLKTAAQAALEALRLQVPLFDPEPTLRHLKWRERIKASFGYDPLECPRCGLTMELVEIWEPKRGHLWMRRWRGTIATTSSPSTSTSRADVQCAPPRIPLSSLGFLTRGIALFLLLEFRPLHGRAVPAKAHPAERRRVSFHFTKLPRWK